MTRKAARKRRQLEAKRQFSHARARPARPWVAVGALVASTVIAGVQPASASGREFSLNPSAAAPNVHRLLDARPGIDDPRLASSPTSVDTLEAQRSGN